MRLFRGSLTRTRPRCVSVDTLAPLDLLPHDLVPVNIPLHAVNGLQTQPPNVTVPVKRHAEGGKNVRYRGRGLVYECEVSSWGCGYSTEPVEDEITGY